MIISSNMLQPLVSNDLGCAASFAEPNEVSPGQQPVKADFNKLFAKAVRTTSGTPYQGTAASNSSEGQTVTAGLSMDETNPVNSKTELSKIMTLLDEIKLSLTEKTEVYSESADQSGTANVSTPAVPPELLQKLETIVIPDKAGTEGLLPMLTKESTSEEKFPLLREAVRELKQALQKPEVHTVAADSGAAITAVTSSVPELLQKVEQLVNQAAMQAEASTVISSPKLQPALAVKPLQEAVRELKQALQKPEVQTAVADSAAAITAVPLVVPELLQKVEQLVQQVALPAETSTVIRHPELKSASTTWIDNAQQQAEGTELIKSADLPPVGDSLPKVVKGTNVDGFLLKSVNSPTTSVIEQSVNGPKSDTAAKYAEHADFTSIAMVSRTTASKGNFSFTDEGAQQNTGGKGANSTANPTPVTNAGVIEFSVQNQSQPQPLSQPENARVSVQEHIMNQVKEKLAQYEPTSKVGNITIKLNPGELGELKVNMRMEDMRLKVDIVAQNQMVKDTIMQNIDSLRDMMSRQNITIDRFDVSTDGGQGFNQAFREGRNAAGSIPYTPYADMPASGEEIIVQKTAYWEPNENQLVNLRF